MHMIWALTSRRQPKRHARTHPNLYKRINPPAKYISAINISSITAPDQLKEPQIRRLSVQEGVLSTD